MVGNFYRDVLVKPTSLVFLGATAVALAGCNGSSSDSEIRASTADTKLANAIDQHGLTGDPSLNRTLPAISDPEAQLGMELFFSKALSGDQDVACVTCHHPALGGGDDLSLSIGVESDDHDLLGPGRAIASSPLPNVPRNAPTTFNMALWDAVLFLDGRVESLNKEPGQNGATGGIRTPDTAFGVADAQAGANLTAAQARFPVTSAEEMRGHTFENGGSNDDVRNHLSDRLSGAVSELATPDNDGNSIDDWPERFDAAFGDNTISYERIASALAAYESSQIFVDTPWRDYVQGDPSALTDSQKNGAVLFFTSPENGGAGCVACHSGDFFTDEEFHNIAMVQIGSGKGDGGDGTDDFGRFRETANADDMYAFRTPTLLNVAETGPFGHAGAYDTLEGIIRHHLNPEEAIDDYFATSVTWCQSAAQFATVADCDALYPSAESNTRKALTELQADQAVDGSELKTVDLNDSEIADLVAFMHALTDPCLKDASCLGQWIPDGTIPGAAGLRINGVDNNTQPLVTN